MGGGCVGRGGGGCGGGVAGASLGMSRLVFTGWRAGLTGGLGGGAPAGGGGDQSLGRRRVALMNMFLSFVARTSVRVFAGFSPRRAPASRSGTRESNGR